MLCSPQLFMAWNVDLRSLKQLGLNSIHHSAMDARERAEALLAYNHEWSTFIQSLLREL